MALTPTGLTASEATNLSQQQQAAIKNNQSKLQEGQLFLLNIGEGGGQLAQYSGGKLNALGFQTPTDWQGKRVGDWQNEASSQAISQFGLSDVIDLRDDKNYLWRDVVRGLEKNQINDINQFGQLLKPSVAGAELGKIPQASEELMNTAAQRLTSPQTSSGQSPFFGIPSNVANQFTHVDQAQIYKNLIAEGKSSQEALTQAKKFTQNQASGGTPINNELKSRVDTTNGDLIANKDFVNAVFKAYHGRDANAKELLQFSGKKVSDVRNAIIAGSPLNKNLSVNVPDTVEASKIGQSGGDINLTGSGSTTKDPITFTQGLSSIFGNFSKDLQTILGLANLPTQGENNQNKLFERLANELEKNDGKGAREAQLREELGYTANLKELMNLNTQIAQKTAEYNSLIQSIEGKPGVSMGSIRGQQGQVLKMQAIELGNLGIMATALQGNVELASDIAKDTVDLEYADIEQEINDLKTLLTVNESIMTAEQKRKADSLAIILDERSRVLEDQKFEKEKMYTLAIEAAKNGASSSTLSSIMNAGSFEEALKVGGTSLGSQMSLLGGLSKEQISIYQNLASQVRQDQDIKNFIEIRQAYDRIKTVGANPSAAGDLALIFNYMKMLDPGSTVREGEFANAQNSAGVPEQIRAQWNKIVSGERLTTETRQDFLTQAKNLYASQLTSYDRAVSFYENQASTFGIPSDLILRDFEITGNEYSNLPALNQSYNSLADLTKDNPAFRPVVEQMINDGLEDGQILQILSMERGGSSKMALSPLAVKISTKYPEGSVGGQCGDFAHKLVEFPSVGDSKTAKINTVNKIGIPANLWRNDVRVGDVIITGENPTYGHVAVVNAILPDGTIQLSESNFKQSNKVSHDRKISINSPKIYGALRGNIKLS